MRNVPKTRNDLAIKIYEAMDKVWGYPIQDLINWKYKDTGEETWKFCIGHSFPTAYTIEFRELRNGWIRIHSGAEDNYGWDYEIGIDCVTNIAVDFVEPLLFLKKYMEQMKLESHFQLTPEMIGT